MLSTMTSTAGFHAGPIVAAAAAAAAATPQVRLFFILRRAETGKCLTLFSQNNGNFNMFAAMVILKQILFCLLQS